MKNSEKRIMNEIEEKPRGYMPKAGAMAAAMIAIAAAGAVK